MIVYNECNCCSWWEHSGCANFEENELVLLHGTTSQNILFICSSCLPKLPAARDMETALTNKFDSFTDHVNIRPTKESNQGSVCQINRVPFSSL